MIITYSEVEIFAAIRAGKRKYTDSTNVWFRWEICPQSDGKFALYIDNEWDSEWKYLWEAEDYVKNL